MDQLAQTSRPGAGRPTREQAQRRHEELLDRALELFLEKGFELATIEAIAASVGMTKRTVYARYPDKSALFKATVQRAIERWIVPVETLAAAETEDLEESLLAIARIRLANVMSPAGLRLQRIINTESYRFPEIFELAHGQGTQPTIRFLADLLRRRAAVGQVQVDEPEMAATAFMSLVLSGPARVVVLGGTVDPVEVDARMRYGVRLFLDGVRPR